MNRNIKPIIFGGYVNGYSIARSIYETFNIRSIVMDHNKHFSTYSDFIDYFFVPNPKNKQEDFIKTVLEFGKRDPHMKKIIFVTNDLWLIPLLKNKGKLDDYYIFPFSDWNVIRNLIVKDKLYQICEDIGINYPSTQKIVCVTDLDFEKINFPVLVKPTNVVDFQTNFRGEKRNNIFNDKDGLIRYLEPKLINEEFESGFIVQNYIRGGAENLYTITTYSNKNFDIKGASVGYKLTQYPPDAGTIRSGYVTWVDGLFENTQKLFKKTKFYGIANTEYKIDPETGDIYMIEVNARPGKWNFSAYKTGVDLFGMSLKEHVLNKNIDFKRSNKNIVWTTENKTRLLNKIKGTKVYEQIKNGKDLEFIDPRQNSEERFRYKSYLFIVRMRDILKDTIEDINPSIAEKIKNFV